MSVESLPRTGDNHFNLLRMIAACAVIVSHSYPLSLGLGTQEPFESIAGFSLGTAAVIAFFSISGYFISLSFDRRKSALAFINARILRIFPGLAVVALLSAFVLGPLLTNLTLPNYLEAAWKYPFKVVTLYGATSTLPDVFTDNPYPDAVNGSLWTLYFEVMCYAALFSIGLLRLLKFLPWLVAIYIILHGAVWIRLGWNPYLYLSLAFLIGILAFRYPKLINGWISLGLLIAATVSAFFWKFPHIWLLTIAFGVLWAGFKPNALLQRYNNLGDYSYGVYIYAFPIQQILAAEWRIGPILMMVITLTISIICGALSWHFIEKPALRLKEYRSEFFRRRDKKLAGGIQQPPPSS